jgi:hypothetical protein
MNSNAQKILRRLACDFDARHHGMVSQLDDFKVSVIELADFSRSGMARRLSEKPTLEDTLIDLRSRGYLKSTDSSLYVSLTELGLKEGSRGSFVRLWDFINDSPGIAILISLGSLIVAIIALLKT